MCVDVRGCSRGIRAPVREFSRSMSENRAKAWINAYQRFCSNENSGEIRRFSRESQGTRGVVLNRIPPQFPNSYDEDATLFRTSACEI